MRAAQSVVRALLPGAQVAGQPATLGVLGGGQLGRMLVQAAQTMGYYTAVLDPDAHSPAGWISHYHIQTDYLDEAGLAQLMQRCSAITTEFENVPAAALRTLAAHRPVAPHADAVAIAQDRRAEKAHFVAWGVPCAPFAVIESDSDLCANHAHLLPGILKTACLGYDGKGQVQVRDGAELAAAWHTLQRVPCVLEPRLALAAECSAIVARAADGCCVHLPVQRNVHVHGILAETHVYEGNLPAQTVQQAQDIAQRMADAMDYVGVLCVEFFVLQDGRLIVNEIAPRPHNSGHYTVDACDLSQFDLQVRTLMGLPLVQPRQHSAAIMLNLLGDLWFDPQGHPLVPPWDAVQALPGAHLHLYGKLQARPGRKMGHLTFTGPTVQAVRDSASQAAAVLGLPALS